MKKILIQLDSDKFASVFDTITAYDAGVDSVLQYGGVTIEDVRDLVYGAMFTRGGDALKNSSVFVGGSDVSYGEKMTNAVVKSFFGPVRVSVMLDSNGCNTTAVAAVRKIVSVDGIKGKKAVVLGGTGPVGMRAAALMAGEGAEVSLTSRSLERSEKTCASIKERFDVEVSPAEVQRLEDTQNILDGAYAALCSGAAGITLIPESVWGEHSTLRVLADVNAVPPLGIENTKPHWDGKEKGGKIIFGALGIGGLKMKIHRGCLSRLFKQNDLVLDAEEIYEIAKAMDNK
ncbi:NADP-dependent methylenetetrahydromethanopterin/methylenetetrahydrofolate dehydrogenase [Desulfococcaceae bacterium HSG7]|nr:NADP-dependent methylenetetrahydromethanopterin/methylenetetrahydrofolate dehydrogenase [Desulfococcaceae bacterium HSG7]